MTHDELVGKRSNRNHFMLGSIETTQRLLKRAGRSVLHRSSRWVDTNMYHDGKTKLLILANSDDDQMKYMYGHDTRATGDAPDFSTMLQST